MNKSDPILITGAAGYIGTHVLMELRERGFDNLHAIDRHLLTSPNWIGGLVRSAHGLDILSLAASEALSQQYSTIIHLAAYISVEESTKAPITYWRNNLLSTNRIIDNLKGAHLIFASTGTAFQPENPYAQTKVACENEIIDRLVDGYTIFRFYNVSGMRPGVSPTGHATHLIRRAAMAAKGLLPEIQVFGTDWPTRDGTCIRDYIDVRDLAASIVNAVQVGPANTEYECLGSGKGYTVNEVLTTMKQVSGVDFRVTIAPRRPGDVAEMICPTQYKHCVVEHSLRDMCISAFNGITGD